jgi:hypothetical protein
MLALGYFDENEMKSRLLKFGLLSFCLLVLLRCAIIIPVPDGEVLSGSKITSENIAFIEQGITSRSDVIQKLGPPYMDLKELRTIAYTWDVLGVYMPWIAGYPTVGGGYGGVEKIGKPYVLLIAFDKDDHVSKFEIKERWPLDTVKSHVIKWIERENFDVPTLPNDFVALELPEGQAGLYVYRPGGWRDAPLLHQPAVSIDGEVVAELRKGGYITRVLQAGLHTVSVNPDVDVTTSLNPDKIIVRTFSFDALPDTAYYLEVRVKYGFGALDPELTIRPPKDAMPVLKELKPTW